jgi:hypothetical protein
MVISSILVVGDDGDAGAPAIALARRGFEVTLLGGTGEEPAQRAREAGVEVRAGTALVGFVTVDRHVEAELSDGRIENYDAIVRCVSGQQRVIAQPAAAAAVARLLA